MAAPSPRRPDVTALPPRLRAQRLFVLHDDARSLARRLGGLDPSGHLAPLMDAVAQGIEQEAWIWRFEADEAAREAVTDKAARRLRT